MKPHETVLIIDYSQFDAEEPVSVRVRDSKNEYFLS